MWFHNWRERCSRGPFFRNSCSLVPLWINFHSNSGPLCKLCRSLTQVQRDFTTGHECCCVPHLNGVKLCEMSTWDFQNLWLKKPNQFSPDVSKWKFDDFWKPLVFSASLFLAILSLPQPQDRKTAELTGQQQGHTRSSWIPELSFNSSVGFLILAPFLWLQKTLLRFVSLRCQLRNSKTKHFCETSFQNGRFSTNRVTSDHKGAPLLCVAGVGLQAPTVTCDPIIFSHFIVNDAKTVNRVTSDQSTSARAWFIPSGFSFFGLCVGRVTTQHLQWC